MEIEEDENEEFYHSFCKRYGIQRGLIMTHHFLNGTQLQCMNSSGTLLINGMHIRKNSTYILNSGDELVIAYLNRCAYVFQQLIWNVSFKTPSEVSGTGLSYGRQVGDPSSVVGCHPMSSLSSYALHRTEETDWTRGLISSQSSGMSKCEAIFKEYIYEEILDGRDVKVSFIEFPYYPSERIEKFLIAASYISLKHSEQPINISIHPRMNPSILLSGPAGSELYQETLVKALGNYYGAKLLIFDRQSIMADVPLHSGNFHFGVAREKRGYVDT